jgi:hypothetical protein
MIKLTLAVALCCALSCRGDESGDDAVGQPEDPMNPATGGGLQPLAASFKLVPEFDGCEVADSLETDDLSSLGIRKDDLGSFFGKSSPSGTTESGQAEVVSLTLEWLEKKTTIVQARKAPSDDEFNATCPSMVGALPTQISFTSVATGSLSAAGFLFTAKSGMLGGSFNAKSANGSNYVVSIKATGDGATSGVVSEVKQEGGQRESKSLLTW